WGYPHSHGVQERGRSPGVGADASVIEALQQLGAQAFASAVVGVGTSIGAEDVIIVSGHVRDLERFADHSDRKR
ncbi:hypothetical protein G6025_08335, partial [Dietzia natronolimnaea]|nr:hypothetical protein [Dietzia natronolimnaea]